MVPVEAEVDPLYVRGSGSGRRMRVTAVELVTSMAIGL